MQCHKQEIISTLNKQCHLDLDVAKLMPKQRPLVKIMKFLYNFVYYSYLYIIICTDVYKIVNNVKYLNW